MGKFKVSFTTALFVFSFVICVIVAVVFVDRAPKNDYDSFYEGADETRGAVDGESGDSGWAPKKTADQPAKPQPAATVDESSFADLPLDAHLQGAAQPVAMTATPVPTANPMSGRSPEDIARLYMQQSGVGAATSHVPIPGMAIPAGIVTPAAAAQATPVAQQRAQPHQYLPLQSNVGGAAAPGIGNTMPSNGIYGVPSAGATGMPALGSNATNATEGWNPVSARTTPDRMIGVRSAPGNPQNGMMISQGNTETGAEAPAGFSQSITTHEPVPVTGASPGAAAAPGGLDAPLLLPPQPEPGSNKWELPPAPTLRPPPVQDPDQRRSEADPEILEPETPDSLNPDGSSGQALAVSNSNAVDEVIEDEPEFAAQVNDRTLTEEQALKLAEVQFLLNDEILTEDKRDAEAKKAAETWAEITAAAELARENDIAVGKPEVEKYAAMRPDFDPAAWQSAMAENGFSKEDIRQQLTDIALSEKLVELEFAREIEDDDIKNAYEKTPSRFASPRQVHLQEIYKDKPDDEKRVERVADSIRRLQRQAAAGTDFGLLARQASQAANRQKGGDLGWITPSETKDDLRDKAITDLKPGQVSDVVEEPDGYRIYKLVAVKEARDDFEGGKDLVIAELKKPIRKNSLADARDKLESGEPLVKDNITTAKTGEPGSAESTDSDSDSESSAEDAKAAARKVKAQQLLAEATARRNAAKRQQKQQQEAQELQPAGPVTITQQPAAANQLLYAPGTQVQQMAGGQPAPPYQPGGQTPAPPVHSPLTTPDSVSVNYAPGQTMQVAGNTAGSMGLEGPAPESTYIDLSGLQSGAQTNTQAMFAPRTQGNPQSQSQGIPQSQTKPMAPAPVHSNGWVVTKTNPQDMASASAAADDTQNRESQDGRPRNAARGNAPSAQSGASVPPGFEVSGQGESPSSNDNDGEGKGLIGNVKSFFGGLGR